VRDPGLKIITRRMLKALLKYFFLLVNIGVALLLILARFIPTLSPAKFSGIGFLGLIVPYLAVFNIMFILFWLILRKWLRVGISLAAILIGWNIFQVGWAFHQQEKAIVKGMKPRVKVITYNVRLMNLYQWSKDEELRDKMIQFLKKENSDILCLQEFFSKYDSVNSNVNAIMKECAFPYKAESHNFDTKRGFFGDIIFSKYPIQSQQQMNLLGQKKYFQFADISIANKMIRIYNLHLQSIKFSTEDRNIIDQKNYSKYPEATNVIIKKLETGFKIRAAQADQISSEIQKSPFPVLVVGDFNDLPSSYAYFKVRGKLNDVFLDKGFGIGRTFNSLSPSLRIDHLFYDASEFHALNFEIPHVPYSDHFPLVAEFSI
jgi:endonuclease/exonuclease/phosphatase family metal-dependent hydrolase